MLELAPMKLLGSERARLSNSEMMTLSGSGIREVIGLGDGEAVGLGGCGLGDGEAVGLGDGIEVEVAVTCWKHPARCRNRNREWRQRRRLIP